MTTAEICKLLGLAPDTPPGEIREAVAALPPEPVLDEVACRGAGLEPELVAVAGIVDYSQEIAHHTYSDPRAIYLPVSSDPAASHQLAMAALEKGLGSVVAWQGRSGWRGMVIDPSTAPKVATYPEGCTVLLESVLSLPTYGTTPMHAAAGAVAVRSLERSEP